MTHPDDAAGEGGEHGAERSGLGGYHERHHPEGGDVVGEDGAHPPEYCQQEEAEHLHALGGEALKRGHHKEDDGRRDAKEEEYKLFGVEKRKYSLVFHWEPHSFKVLGSLFDAEAASDDAHLGLGGAAHEAHDAGVAELPGDGHLGADAVAAEELHAHVRGAEGQLGGVVLYHGAVGVDVLLAGHVVEQDAVEVVEREVVLGVQLGQLVLGVLEGGQRLARRVSSA